MADFQEHHTQNSIDKHKPVNSRNDCVLGSMLEPPAAMEYYLIWYPLSYSNTR